MTIKNLTICSKKIYSHITKIKGNLILFSVPLFPRYSCYVTEQSVRKKQKNNNITLYKDLAICTANVGMLLIRWVL